MWGIAGVGKSTLVRSIYHSQEEKRKFAMFSWVDVPAKFHLTDLSWHLLLDFHSNNFENKGAAAIGIMEGRDPVQECCKILRQHRCLIVIDGLRSTHDWDLIKHAFSSVMHTNKSCIVVISNEKNLAEHVIRDIAGSQVLIIKCLPADVSRSIFTEVAPKCIKGLAPDDGMDQATSMDRLTDRAIDVSGGLPKVIAALGKELESATSGWHARKILNNYRRIDSLSGVFSWMQSYFDACSDSVKPCIFYLSVFPMNQDIRRRRLVTRWIAEGYSRDRFGGTAEDWDISVGRSDGATADEKGEKYFSDLIALSIIQQFTTSNVCQINGFFHGYITSRPMEDNLVCALEGRCKLNSQRTGQHLTIRRDWDRDMKVFQSIDFTRLRSLSVFGKWESFLISDKMERLRVLDLEDADGVQDGHLEKMVKQLTRLKFLSLRGCKGIHRLPDSLGGMRQLQTLDVRHTPIAMLPPEICKLAMLQYIRAGNTKPWHEGDGMVAIQPTADEDWKTTPLQEGDGKGVEVPTGIGNLTALHTLGVVNVSRRLLELEELKKLTQLHRLKVSGIKRGNIKQFFCAISGHRHLESLSVRLEENMQPGILATLAPPPKTLRNLKLYGEHAPNLTLWIELFQSVKLWDIEMCVTRGEDLRPLDELLVHKIKVLRRLCVKLVRDDLDHLDLCLPDCQSVNFQNLKIDCRSKCKITFGKSKLVEVLKIRCSSGSDLQVFELANLASLKEVWLMGSCGDALKQGLKQQLSKYKGQRPVVKLVQSRPCHDGC